MRLQTRMYLLIALMFGILCGVTTGVGNWMGAGSAISYLALAFVFIGIQYLVSPAIVGWTTRIKLGASHKHLELFTTHPNMLKRIKHLSTLAV